MLFFVVVLFSFREYLCLIRAPHFLNEGVDFSITTGVVLNLETKNNNRFN